MAEFNLNNSEYQFIRDNKYLGNNIILLGYGGSYAYGTNIEGSDIDLRGVATRTPYAICTGYDFEEVVNNETDTTIYSFDKMLKLLAECNPNCIEILGLKPEHYFIKTDLGQELLDRKEMFLSRHCINTFGGYATQQLYRLRQKTLDALSPEEYNDHIIKVIKGMSEHLQKSWNFPPDRIAVRNTNSGLVVDIEDISGCPLENFYGMCNEISNTIRTYNKNSKRNEKALSHNKVAKHAMHLLRLYIMAIDLLVNQEIVTYRGDEHDLLMSIRSGEFTDSDTGMMNKNFWELLSEYEAKFEQAKKITKLPDHPDYVRIRNFQSVVNRQIVLDGKFELEYR